jgi:2'-5' RNA ligase
MDLSFGVEWKEYTNTFAVVLDLYGEARNMKDSGLWQNYFDIVILPPPAIQDHAIALSKRLEPYGGKFVLGKNRFIPHISLYHIPVRPERFAAFSDAVRNVASTHPGGTLQLTSVDMPVLVTGKPEWLSELHRKMVEHTNAFLDREYGVEKTWDTEYLPAELKEPARRYLKEFGSPLIDEVFRPHITLTSFEDKSSRQSIPEMNFDRLSFEADAVSICELGPSHSCQRIIATYPLI